MLSQAILLLSCADQRGITADVTRYIADNDGNILESDQHHDIETGQFFTRIKWDASTSQKKAAELTSAFHPLAEKYKMTWHLKFAGRPQKLALMVSQYDHCLYDLLVRQRRGELDVEIAAVITNHANLEGVAQHFDVPFYYSPKSKETKLAAEDLELKILADLEIDFIALCRYMQILSPKYVNAYPNRIINIHHSFLPAFIGAKPYHQAFARGVKIIGATSHYVTEELDQGPIIEQDVVRINHRDTVKDLVQKGRNLETTVLSRAVSFHLQHRVLVYNGNKTIVFV